MVGVDIVGELRKDNATLNKSYERAKRKQELRIKWLQLHQIAVTSRYETIVVLLKNEVALLEENTCINDD